MATATISGQDFVSVGYKTTLTADIVGGVWSSSDTTIATVSNTGVVTGVLLGEVDIYYAVSGITIRYPMSVSPVRISNGFNLDRILPAFRERLGWHQPSKPQPVISAVNKRATSGRYYDRGFHNAVSILNYYAAQEDSRITDKDFNQLLTDADDACTMQILNSVFTRPAFVEHKPNYTRIWNMQPYLMPNQGNVVGYRINVAAGNFACVLNSIALYFSDVATFPIYLYNDLLLPPVKQIEVTTVANSQTRIQLEWLMNYMDSSDNGGNSSGNIGGVWYLCYKQSDVVASNPNCFAVDEQLNLWTQGKVMGAFPFQSPENDVYAFARNNPSINFRSFGLNIEYTCYRDYTQMIIQSPHLYDEAKGLAMAIYVIQELCSSSRTNGDVNLMRYNVSEMKTDLDQAFPTKDFPFVSGLKARLSKELKTLQQRFSGKPDPTSVSISDGLTDVWAQYYQGFDLRALPPRDTFQSR